MERRRTLHEHRPLSEDSDEEFSVTTYETNVHPSAVEVLAQIPGVTPANVQQWLHTARLLSPIEDMYDYICQYVGNSQCHRGFGLKIHNIIRVARVNQPRLGQNDPSLRNKDRMLLWHGTKEAFVPRILEHGFQQPPANGQMFGTGIYFADRASKSSRYCPPDDLRDGNPGEIGYMFLCDVLLGKAYNSKNAKNHYTAAPSYEDRYGNEIECDSVKCTGEFIPDMRENKIIRGNLIIPCGETVRNDRFDEYTVLYNEFIVYGGDRCKPDYLVKFEFTQNPVEY